MTARRAKIIGGGFAGLSAAIALRQHGWDVTLNERGPEIRAYGSALALSENGLKTLEMLGAYDDAVRGAFPLFNRETRDGDGRLISSYNWKTEDTTLRMFMLLRSRVIDALAAAARASGVDVRLSSEVVESSTDGAIGLSGGERRAADLVVIADGAGSRNPVRASLLKMRRRFSDGSIRMLLPRAGRPEWPAGTFAEFWSGRRRAMLAPCSESHFYLGLIARQGDVRGTSLPVDVGDWTAAFPALRDFLSDIPAQERWSWDQYQTVKLRRWSAGQAVVIGDAAHAMSPNFGQGAALAMVSALSLATCLEQDCDQASALRRWEALERPLIERTQWLSGLYSAPMGWPPALRDAALAMMGRSRWIMRQRTLAAYRTPPGYDPGRAAGVTGRAGAE